MDLPEGWIKKESKSRQGKFYYFNTRTNESSWEKPSSSKKGKRKSEEREREERGERGVGERGEERSNKKKKEREIKASHILIKHINSRNPSSHRDKSKVTRTEEEAREILESLKEKLEKGEASFEDLASQNSDCGSFRAGGDLGYFSHSKMQKAFSDAAFNLSVDQISDIVSSESGLHLIKRTA